MRDIIFDLDLTLADTSVCEQARAQRNWPLAYSLIPQCALYDGIEEVFAAIRQQGIKACVVSTSPRPYLEKLVRHFNMPIQWIVGEHDAPRTKPHPASMLRALELMGSTPNNAISFGDRLTDIQASDAAGIESVACFWGTKDRNALINSNYSHAVVSPSEILSFIR